MGHASTYSLVTPDSTELLNVEMQQLAGLCTLVADDRRARDERGQAAEAQAAQHIPHCGKWQTQSIGDRRPRSSLRAQLSNPLLEAYVKSAG
jgi:hypothetical protein